jgi:reverse transcriptase-like protein
MSHPPVAEGDGRPLSAAFRHLCSWENLVLAWRAAARGKRGTAGVARFEYRVEEHLHEVRIRLLAGSYRPGPYVHFHVSDPKRRKISAVRFEDRVVHHALCNVIEPRFERLFIPDSYANRVGKGTHRAIDRLQSFARHYRFVLRADIVQHFASVDHAILLDILRRQISEPDVMRLIAAIVDSGRGVLDDEYRYVRFAGDDLLAVCRPRGLPIGNLTSQFWSNCYLHPFDQFVARELGCRAYLRYVDDCVPRTH